MNTENNDDDEVIFEFPNTIGKRRDLDEANSRYYVIGVLSRILDEFNVDCTKKVGILADVDTLQYLLIDVIEGYQKYWGDDIPGLVDKIDAENPLPDKL